MNILRLFILKCTPSLFTNTSLTTNSSKTKPVMGLVSWQMMVQSSRFVGWGPMWLLCHPWCSLPSSSYHHAWGLSSRLLALPQLLSVLLASLLHVVQLLLHKLSISISNPFSLVLTWKSLKMEFSRLLYWVFDWCCCEMWEAIRRCRIVCVLKDYTWHNIPHLVFKYLIGIWNINV